eukprot:52175-Eustigmatos_ZCMA.PRE.1
MAVEVPRVRNRPRLHLHRHPCTPLLRSSPVPRQVNLRTTTHVVPIVAQHEASVSRRSRTKGW